MKRIMDFVALSCIFAIAGCAMESKEYCVEKVKTKVVIKAHPFSLKQVRLLEGPFKEAMERNRKYLHELESDRLLHMFRINAGLPSSARPLGGWERPDCELRGHTIGHYLTACALMYSSAGDEKLKAKANAIVAELAKCQKALGDNGYLSAYPESFIDRVIAREKVWAPWYTLHKIYAGLIDMYVHCGNKQALEVAEKMAAWAKMRTDRLTEEQMQSMLDTEFGGMNEVLANLYAVTGNCDYLKLAQRFDHKVIFEPLSQREDKLKGLHANTQIPKAIGAAREYELTGDKYYYEIAMFFWDTVVSGRCYATGGTSDGERWPGEPYHLADQLSNVTHETCCTYNLLKLTRHLFSWNPDVRYADYYERALINGILSTQDPDNGMMMYYVPMASGWYKTFCSPRNSFWCCTGTGMENPAKYGDSIYFYDDKGVFVNLFIASELTWKDKGLVIRQETKFPEEESTTLIINPKEPMEIALRIRVPYWTAKGIAVKINGEKQKISATPGSYLTLSRKWNKGDWVEISMPMSLHLHRMPDDKNLAAIMYGPLVLSGQLGKRGVTKTVVSGPEHAERRPADAPNLVVTSDNLSAWIEPVPGEPLTFQTVDVGEPNDVTLIPFHKLFDERYAIYWQIYTGNEWQQLQAEREASEKKEAEELKVTDEQIVDRVEIGDDASESEHNLQGEETEAGPFGERVWRHALDGWFSYDLKVLPDEPMMLMCTYWGSDSGRTFDVIVNDKKIATQELDFNRPDEFFEVRYKIPPELTAGKNKVTVKFRSHSGSYAGGVFGCVMLKGK